ncbi:MAG: phosphatidylinositol mannoside acyltransferase [Actinomycetales bacterium]
MTASAPQRLRGRITDAVTEAAFVGGWQVIKRLPERPTRWAATKIADRSWRRQGPAVRQLERNLARVESSWSTDELRELSRTAMRSYLRYWQEAFQLPAWSHERISSTFNLVNVEILDAAAASGTGVIMVPGHMANWDHAGAWAALRYGRVVTVAERLKPAGLFERFLDYRRSLGMEVYGTGDPDVVRQLARRLKDGCVVALLGDRDIGRNGVEVDLLGQPASLPAGPALLSILTGAPLYPVSMWFEPVGSLGWIHDRVEIPQTGTRADQVRTMTQQIADALGEGIRDKPQDWHMMQPLWRADLIPRMADTSSSGHPDGSD